MRFIHAGRCKGEHEPECLVTRVQGTNVFYKLVNSDKRTSCDVMAFGGKVKSLIVEGLPYTNPYATGSTLSAPFSHQGEDGKV
jgi:hypothetical protein